MTQQNPVDPWKKLLTKGGADVGLDQLETLNQQEWSVLLKEGSRHPQKLERLYQGPRAEEPFIAFMTDVAALGKPSRGHVEESLKFLLRQNDLVYSEAGERLLVLAQRMEMALPKDLLFSLMKDEQLTWDVRYRAACLLQEVSPAVEWKKIDLNEYPAAGPIVLRSLLPQFPGESLKLLAHHQAPDELLKKYPSAFVDLFECAWDLEKSSKARFGRIIREFQEGYELLHPHLKKVFLETLTNKSFQNWPSGIALQQIETNPELLKMPPMSLVS